MGDKSNDKKKDISKGLFTFKDNNIEYSNKDIQTRFLKETVNDIKIHLFRFNSPNGKAFFPDYTDQNNSPRYDNRANISFMARVYLPRQKTDRVAIIFNGLDETVNTLEEEQLFGFYDNLGAYLADHQIQAILLPTPYHLNRVLSYIDIDKEAEIRKRIKDKHEKYTDYTMPTNALIRRPNQIYRNHFQGYRETIALCSLLNSPANDRAFKKAKIRNFHLATETNDLLVNRLTEKTQITLVGYSLGGLRALTEFLVDRLRCSNDKTHPDPLFTSCVAINSGGALSDLPPPFWVDRLSWKDMINKLCMKAGEERLKGIPKKYSEIATEHFNVLDDVFLGKASTIAKLEDEDKRISTEMLFTLGGADELVRLEHLRRLSKTGGLNLFQVAGVGHMFRYGSWGPWKASVFTITTNFIHNTCDARLVPQSEQIAEFLGLLDHKYGILDYNKSLLGKDVYTNALKKLTRLKKRTPVINTLGKKRRDEILKNWKNPTVDIDEVFINYSISLLNRLKKRIEEMSCHPRIYKQVRRKQLFGWYLVEDTKMIDNWQAIIDKENPVKKKKPKNSKSKKSGTKIKRKRKLGELLIDRDVVTERQINSAVARQKDDFDKIRDEMVKEFIKDISKRPGQVI